MSPKQISIYYHILVKYLAKKKNLIWHSSDRKRIIINMYAPCHGKRGFSVNLFMSHRLRNKFLQRILISLDSVPGNQYWRRMYGPMEIPKFTRASVSRTRDLKKRDFHASAERNFQNPPAQPSHADIDRKFLLSVNFLGPYSSTIFKNILCLFSSRFSKFECNATSDWVKQYGLANQKLCYIQMLLAIEKKTSERYFFLKMNDKSDFISK